jgi:hypothetical protein
VVNRSGGGHPVRGFGWFDHELPEIKRKAAVNPLVTITFFLTDLAQTRRKCLKWPKNKLTFQIKFLKLKIKKFF